MKGRHLYQYPPTSGIEVKDNPDRRKPEVGDKIIITNWSMFDGKEAVRLSKLPYVTVSDVLPVPLGMDGNYEWHYEVSIEESDDEVGTEYKFYEQ